VTRRYDCADPEQRAEGRAAALAAIQAGELVVIPTDTVYGIGADAFTPSAVNALLDAKGRGRDVPVPVLVGSVRAASALVEELGTYGQDLIDTFWPGPLTLICRAGRSLNWDLGDTKGTVAIRMPLHSVALELLKETGPMAVSSANRTGAPPATTAAEAEGQLGESVAVYLDAGPCADNIPSTIVDLTTAVPRVLRQGAISVEKLRSVIGYVATDGPPTPDPEPTPAPTTEPTPAPTTEPTQDPAADSILGPGTAPGSGPVADRGPASDAEPGPGLVADRGPASGTAPDSGPVADRGPASGAESGPGLVADRGPASGTARDTGPAVGSAPASRSESSAGGSIPASVAEPAVTAEPAAGAEPPVAPAPERASEPPRGAEPPRGSEPPRAAEPPVPSRKPAEAADPAPEAAPGKGGDPGTAAGG
jgi:tRNA threonylcarbamoyl adenosine modification protein (Sua5/YciO/YrdC/YwlC family)